MVTCLGLGLGRVNILLIKHGKPWGHPRERSYTWWMCHVSLQEEKSKAYEVRDLPPKKNIIVKKSQYEASWLILGAIQPGSTMSIPVAVMN